MSTLNLMTNPFVSFMNPELVLSAVERSPGLRSLRGQQYRPLDTPRKFVVADMELSAFDEEVDRTPIEFPAELIVASERERMLDLYN